MQELEVAFFDEYKRVDAICSDMYSCREGVTEYISQMEQTSLSKSRGIASWNDTLRTLKLLRRLRNRIAHQTADSDCTQRDLDELVAFHNALLRQNDPLSFLYRTERIGRAARPSGAPAAQKNDLSPLPHPPAFFYAAAVVALLAAAALFFLFVWPLR